METLYFDINFGFSSCGDRTRVVSLSENLEARYMDGSCIYMVGDDRVKGSRAVVHTD